MADIINLLGPQILALVGISILAAIILAIAVYVYCALALMAIANKKNIANPWLAFVPIGNVYLMTQIGKVSPFFTLGILAVAIPFIGAVAVAVLMAFIWWKIAEAIGRPGWWGILMVAPIVNFVIIGIMAWGKKNEKY